jgi:hypothetical protein
MRNASRIGNGSRIVMAASALAWMAFSIACSGAAPAHGGGNPVADDAGDDDGGAQEAGPAEDADPQEPDRPMYMGVPDKMDTSDASHSIAAPDGACPLPASLVSVGPQCPSCAQTHCASALAECDPTMVAACNQYYCPTQCPSTDPSTAGACMALGKCCPMLFGTSLYGTCFSTQLAGKDPACASILAEAQSDGHCN